ncbi:VWA domain-containing protein [Mycobacteroides salmoniphilum]|nr:VWA domain-containing protein [Mycobacteroides salmoniphilum]
MLQRWRLILGEPGGDCARLTGDMAGRDAALSWLYGRDDELAARGTRPSGERAGGDGESLVGTVEWINEVHRLFPRNTVERLERDALERYQIQEIVTNPDVLARARPNQTLLRAVLRTKHLMNQDVLDMARKLVTTVVQDLVDKLSVEVREAFSGPRLRRRSIRRSSRDLDVRATIRRNLRHYDTEHRRIVIERPLFTSRSQRHLEKWQIIMLVDQSGSMLGSVIHSAVTASCLWNLPGVRTHLVAFDTSIVDLTRDLTDPVELLMKVQLGGGTDIAKAVSYGAGLIENPQRTIFVLISDLFEGGDPRNFTGQLRALVEQGSKVFALAALDENAEPSYDRAVGQLLASFGVEVGALTPGHLVDFLAECLAAHG